MADNNTKDIEQQSDESDSTTTTQMCCILVCLSIFVVLGMGSFCFDLYDFITTVKNNQATKAEKIFNGLLISATVFSFCGLCELLRQRSVRAYTAVFIQSTIAIILAILNLTGKSPLKKY